MNDSNPENINFKPEQNYIGPNYDTARVRGQNKILGQKFLRQAKVLSAASSGSTTQQGSWVAEQQGCANWETKQSEVGSVAWARFEERTRSLTQ